MKYLFVLSWLISFISYSQPSITHHQYDTEFGRFDVWIYGNQITGSYEIAPKKIIGSIWGTLNGQFATARWADPDGLGDIEITFSEDLSTFRADYRGDKDPDKWYRDQWHGKLTSRQETEESDPCSTLAHQLIRPFIGIWEEYRITEENEEEFIGTLEVKLGAGGCSLLQQFNSPDSSFFYTTQGFVDPGSGQWEEDYVFSNGGTARYQWIVDQGDIVQRRTGGSRPMSYQHQLRFTKLTASGYLLIQERSDDGGQSWAPTGKTRVIRVQ